MDLAQQKNVVSDRLMTRALSGRTVRRVGEIITALNTPDATVQIELILRLAGSMAARNLTPTCEQFDWQDQSCIPDEVLACFHEVRLPQRGICIVEVLRITLGRPHVRYVILTDVHGMVATCYTLRIYPTKERRAACSFSRAQVTLTSDMLIRHLAYRLRVDDTAARQQLANVLGQLCEKARELASADWDSGHLIAGSGKKSVLLPLAALVVLADDGSSFHVVTAAELDTKQLPNQKLIAAPDMSQEHPVAKFISECLADQQDIMAPTVWNDPSFQAAVLRLWRESSRQDVQCFVHCIVNDQVVWLGLCRASDYAAVCRLE